MCVCVWGGGVWGVGVGEGEGGCVDVWGCAWGCTMLAVHSNQMMYAHMHTHVLLYGKSYCAQYAMNIQRHLSSVCGRDQSLSIPLNIHQHASQRTLDDCQH